MIRGEFLVLEYIGLDSPYTEIVSAERLRPKRTNHQPIDVNTFTKFEITVPDDLKE